MDADQNVNKQPPDMVGETHFSAVGIESDEANVLSGVKIEPQGQQSRSPTQEAFARLRRDWRAIGSVSVLAFFVLLALIGPFIYQHIGQPYTSGIDDRTYGPAAYHGYTHEELDRVNELPSGQYWLGTDAIGRDLLARLMQGLLISLILAVSVGMVDLGAGIVIGVLAGYYGGWIDQLLARFTDLIFAFPTGLFLIMLAGIYGDLADTTFGKLPVIGPAGGGRLIILFVALSLFIWPVTARLVRGQAFQLKQSPFVEAARTTGTSDFRIMFRHIVPNLLGIVITSVTLDLVGTISAEAGLSLLGLGIQPPGSSVGLMIASGSPYVVSDPWQILLPSIVLTVIVLAFSFLGDALGDAFDPQVVTS